MGEVDVDAMLAGMSAKQMMGWVHYFGLEADENHSFSRKKTAKEIESILRAKYGKNS